MNVGGTVEGVRKVVGVTGIFYIIRVSLSQCQFPASKPIKILFLPNFFWVRDSTSCLRLTVISKLHVRFSKNQKILRIKLVKFTFIWKFIVSCTGHVWWEQKKQNGEIKHYLYHLQQFGYYQSKVKYKVTSICIWPLLFSAQIPKEHSNTESLCMAWGMLCKERHLVSWAVLPKAEPGSTQPLGLSCHTFQNILPQTKRVPGKVQFAHFLPMTFKSSADFFPEFESRNLISISFSLGIPILINDFQAQRTIYLQQ